MDRNDPPLREWATVTQVTKMLNLSRSRFYQLLREGIFPEPSRHPITRRPIYSREQQEQCLEIKRSCCGLNGKLVLFYDHARKPDALRPAIRAARLQWPRRKRCDSHGPGQNPRDPLIDELKYGLGQLGLADVDEAKIRNALSDEYPDGWRDVDRGVLMRAIFRLIRAQNS